MNSYYFMYVLSLINVLCVATLTISHFLRGFEGWYMIGLLLIPAIIMVKTMDNI